MICDNCMNNPKNNPFASGFCNCALPAMEPGDGWFQGGRTQTEKTFVTSNFTTEAGEKMGSSWINLWVKMSDRYGTYYACSNCGYDRTQTEYEYCPHCGKKMKTSETEKRIGNYTVRFRWDGTTWVYDPEEVKE